MVGGRSRPDSHGLTCLAADGWRDHEHSFRVPPKAWGQICRSYSDPAGYFLGGPDSRVSMVPVLHQLPRLDLLVPSVHCHGHVISYRLDSWPTP